MRIEALEHRERLFRWQLRANQTSFVVVRPSPPSGRPTFRGADLFVASVAREAVGVELVDHLIVGSLRRRVSMRRLKLW